MFMDGDDQNQDAPVDPQGGGMGGDQPTDTPAPDTGGVPAPDAPVGSGEPTVDVPPAPEPESTPDSAPSGDENTPTS